MRASIHVSLPAALKQFVQDQVKERGYSTASEYVREVLRKELEERTRTAVDDQLSAALKTPASAMTQKDWQDIRREGLKRAKKRNR